jgi:hypothetical protein
VTKAKQLGWTPKQIEVYHLLLDGKLTQKDIAKQVGYSEPYVNNIKLSVNAGQYPPGDPPQKKNDEDLFPEDGEVNSQGDGIINPQGDGVNVGNKTEEIKTKKEIPVYSVTSAKMKANIPGVASQLKFINVPMVCPITPIMLNARMLAEIKFGWRKDMPWENFFDTVLVLLFKLYGFTLQGWIEDKQVEDAEAAKPPDAPTDHNGNGHSLVLNPDDIKAIAQEVAGILVALSGQPEASQAN